MKRRRKALALKRQVAVQLFGVKEHNVARFIGNGNAPPWKDQRAAREIAQRCNRGHRSFQIPVAVIGGPKILGDVHSGETRSPEPPARSVLLHRSQLLRVGNREMLFVKLVQQLGEPLVPKQHFAMLYGQCRFMPWPVPAEYPLPRWAGIQDTLVHSPTSRWALIQIHGPRKRLRAHC